MINPSGWVIFSENLRDSLKRIAERERRIKHEIESVDGCSFVTAVLGRANKCRVWIAVFYDPDGVLRSTTLSDDALNGTAEAIAREIASET